MKYYYISHEGPFRNNLIIGKDAERIMRDKNKIIITRIKGMFHVLICRNGIYEKEKHILSYFELVEFLKRNSFNAYFINVNSETAYNIHSYVKKDDEYCKENNVVEKPKSFFTIDSGNILKMRAFVKREIIKDKLDEVYYDEIKDDQKTQTIGLIDFVENSELFGLCNYPINEKNGKFTVPDYSYSKPDLYYMLCGIYNKEGETISLTSDDLFTLFLAKNMNEELVNDIVESVDIDVFDTYDLEEFSKSVDLVDLYKKQENDVHIKLMSMRYCLNEARRNTKYVSALGLLNRINKENILHKGSKKEVKL